MELIIFRDQKEVGRLRLSEGTFSIGRGLHNTIALDDQSISRRHARIRVEADSVIAQDLCSANGTFLAGKPLTQAALEDGDVLEVGPFQVQVHFSDDDFVDHSLDRTQRVNIHTLQSLEEAEIEEDVSQRTVDGRIEAIEAGDEEDIPTADTEGGDQAAEYMAPHDLFGLSGKDALAKAKHEPRPQTSSSHESIYPDADDAWEESEDVEELDESDLEYGPGGVRFSTNAPVLPNTPNIAPKLPLAGRQTDEEPAIDPDAPRLEVRQGMAVRKAFELGRGTSFIGRAEEMEIVLLETNASRRHAAVFWEEDTYILRDLWSLNGLLVNGERVTAARLKPGDRIQIGDTVLEFVWPARATGEPQQAQPVDSEPVPVEDEDPPPPLPFIPPPPRASSLTETVPELRTPTTVQPEAAQRPSLSWGPPAAFFVLLLVGAAALAVFVGKSGSDGLQQQSSPGVELPPPPELPLSVRGQLARAEAGLADGDYEKALDHVHAAQAVAPASTGVRHMVQKVYEARALHRMEVGLSAALHDLEVAQDEATPPEGTDATPVMDPVVAITQGQEAVQETPAHRPTSSKMAGESPKQTVLKKTHSASTTKKPAKTSGVATSPSSSFAARGSKVDQKVSRYYRQAKQARKQGQLVRAVTLYRKAQKQDPYRESALYYQIEDEIQQVRSKLIEKSRPLVADAIALSDRGALAEARVLLEKAVKLAPDYTLAQARLKTVKRQILRQVAWELSRGERLEQDAQTSEARAAYEKVLKLEPNPKSEAHQAAAARLKALE